MIIKYANIYKNLLQFILYRCIYNSVNRKGEQNNMTEQEIKREIRNAYSWVYRHFDEYSDADTNDFMKALKDNEFFEFDAVNNDVMIGTRKMIEKLFAKRGFNPYN